MSYSEHAIVRLLDSLYEGVTDVNSWQHFLSLLAAETVAEKAGFHVHEFGNCADPQNTRGLIAMRVGHSDEELKAYNNRFALQDPYVQRIRTRFSNQLSIGTSAELFANGELERTSYFEEFGRPFGIFHMAWIVLENDNNLVASGLSLLRSIRRKPFASPATQLLHSLGPHMRRTLAAQRKLSQLTSESSFEMHVLDSFGIAVMAIDEKMKAVGCSAAAERLLRPEHGLRCREGQLEALEPRENSKLQTLLRGAVATAQGTGTIFAAKIDGTDAWSPPSGGTVRISRKILKPIQIFIVPFTSKATPFTHPPKALLFFQDAEVSRPSRTHILKTAYGLTPAECRLAELLLAGHSIAACAERTGCTLESTRFVLKSIFNKTDCHRQPDLIRLLLSMPGCSAN